MSTTTCGNCAHWSLSTGPLGAAGLGPCEREIQLFRGARTYSPHAPCCRPLQYAPATAGQVERRQRELAA